MITYQDLLEIGDDEERKMNFVYKSIYDYKNHDDMYKIAVESEAYYNQLNTTINQSKKLIYKMTGQLMVDTHSVDFKLANNFFHYFVVQEVLYLLGNGVTFQNDETKSKLGDDFDKKILDVALWAVKSGVGYGYLNYDHIDVFSPKEFVPMYDEENGALMAGIRYWQISDTKPLRATLYEPDGYTYYIWRDGNGEILQNKKTYITQKAGTKADGYQIYDMENYPSFPIVPLWGNPSHQAEFVGIKGKLDCYDLISSGFANTVEEASYIYWAIQNASGMDDNDLIQFVEKMRTLHAALVDDGEARAEPHSIEAPYASREALLTRLRDELFTDFMALDTKNIASGAVTATQIQAAYEPLNSKTDLFEACVTQFIKRILKLKGIDDTPTYTRSLIINKGEEIQTILSAATALDEEYVTTKIVTLLGDGDLIETIMDRKAAEDIERLNTEQAEQELQEQQTAQKVTETEQEQP